MKAPCQHPLEGSSFLFPGRRRQRRKSLREDVASISLLVLAAGLWPLLPSAGAQSTDSGWTNACPPAGDEVISESSRIRELAIPVEEVTESSFRKSDIAAGGGEERELPYFERAISLEEGKEWRQLLDLSRKWTRAYPKEGAAWFFLGLAQEKVGNYHEAIRAYREAIRRKEDFPKAWCNLGTCYAYLGRYLEAVGALKEAVRQKEDFGRAWSDLGAAYVGLGRPSEAVQALEKATRLRPDLPEAWANLGTAYAESKNYDRAIAATKKALRLKPDYAAAWCNLATLCKETGRKKEMAEACRKMQELDPALGKELSEKLTAP
ncbi:hypothetical protein MAMC_00658 [Methylacidimicrobium cyclopophantes]|uniref:Uncharacterized protein n=1 Tax=Methylacidimicrobium cyclopophantes TaxID=1041766 RepID=A0A5E6M9C8_9BACT|nr:hypothetical protein MAMC_00658 [Methylacidimicrobium cyclopophantes]